MQLRESLKYLKVIQKWWWVIVLLPAVTLITLVTIALMTEVRYEAKVTLQVSAPPPQEVPLYSQFNRQALDGEIARTRIAFQELLTASDLPWQVMDNLPDVSLSGGELQESITVETPDKSQLMHIRVQAADPETAALLANEVVAEGLRRYGELSAQSTANTRLFIEQELGLAIEELETAEAELIQFQIAHKIGNLEGAIDAQYGQVGALKRTRDLAQANGEGERLAAIDSVILEREAELQDLIGLSTEYNRLADRVERLRDTYAFLLDKKTEARIKENQILQLDSIQVLTPARAPRNPVSTINNKIIVAGTVVSIMLGVFLTFVLEYLEVSGALSGLRRIPTERPELVPVSENTG